MKTVRLISLISLITIARAFAVTDLSSLGGTSSEIFGHNATGLLVGSYVAGDAGHHAFIYRNGQLIDINPSAGQGPSPDSYAYGVNSRGSVVGAAQNWHHTGLRAFLYSGGFFTYLDLGAPPDTVAFSEAHSINDGGLIVGTIWVRGPVPNEFIPHAFLWKGGTLIDLNTFLQAGSGWELTDATNIDNNNNVTGHGTLNGQTHTFLLSL